MKFSWLLCALSLSACTKKDPKNHQAEAQEPEYGEAVGIEFGDDSTGRYLAAVAAEGGAPFEAAVPELATALLAGVRACPVLAREVRDGSLPKLQLSIKGGKLESQGSAEAGTGAACMSQAMNGHAVSVEAQAPIALLLQIAHKDILE